MNHEKKIEKSQGFFLEDLTVDQESVLTKTITESDILDFARLTGDNNPVHIDEEFAKQTIFKKRIAHGFLSASLISTLIASKLPGPGSIYLGQTMKFLSPVYIGDTVTVKVKILSINLEKKRVLLLTECFNKDKKILTGEAEILVVSKKK